jgi:hypothetical protein
MNLTNRGVPGMKERRPSGEPVLAEVGPPVILSLGVAGYCSVIRRRAGVRVSQGGAMRAMVVVVSGVLLVACGSKWSQFQAPDASFSVLFPEPPEVKTSGSKQSWNARLGKAVLIVSVEPLGDVEPSTYLDTVEKGAVQDCTRVEGIQPVTVGPGVNVGRELTCFRPSKLGEVRIVMRAYASKGKAFQQSTAEPADEGPVDAAKFWDSLSLGSS